MRKRKNKHPELLQQEREWVNQFVAEKIRVDFTSRFFMDDAFAAYKDWLKRNGLPETSLSLNSFGRMFPKSFRRELIWRAARKRGSRGVKGAELVA